MKHNLKFAEILFYSQKSGQVKAGKKKKEKSNILSRPIIGDTDSESEEKTPSCINGIEGSISGESFNDGSGKYILEMKIGIDTKTLCISYLFK